ncbi:MAG: imelysin family protein [Gammaproteobacteria bacterium]|nr:imelysin family protein [Gammaproteobacteria bacterium]MCP5137071.1 imelysin family protein [Gammaproteobacteria bacterium]
MTRIPALLLLMAFTTSPFAADHQAINLSVTDELIIPGYRHLAQATAAFETATASGCADLDTLRARFHDVSDAWNEVEMWRFGPIEYLDRRGRFWFWPDKHGRMDRQLRQLLRAGDREILGDAHFYETSAALQGMPAAERLLFTALSDDLTAADAYACAYLRAIGHNLHDMATRIVADWTDPDRGERRMVEAIADGGSELYDSADEYTAQLLKSLHTQLLAIRDLKFDRPLGEDLDHARPHRAEFWRSTRALRNIRHNLHAVRALYDAIRPAITDATLAEAIQADFEHAEAALAAIDTPLSEAVADPAHRPQVEAARAAIDTLAERVGKELPAALGLALGFNSLDGD